MKWSRSVLIPFLAALFCAVAAAQAPPQPGTLNYVEGQVAIDGQALNQSSAGSTTLGTGQSLSTDKGRAEILLVPGIFFRVGNNSTVQMISPDLANTTLTLQRGRALVEVASIFPANNVSVNENGVSTRLLKPGLYDFDADHSQVRVYDGKASVEIDGRQVSVKGSHELSLNMRKLKPQKFEKSRYEDDFYRWASLRSSYLTEANVDAARRYAGGSAWAPGLWYGSGWYWDPWFDGYTFIPGDGVFYSPFGWGFYSPGFVYAAPPLGFVGGIHHHFGRGYQPAVPMARHDSGFAGHAGAPAYGFGNRGGFRPSGGFGGFHGRGSGGGGFHGGSGRR